MSNSGRLIIVSGLSGVGKGTVIRKYLELYPGESVLSISATSRPPRPGEEEGKAYFFKTRQEFEDMIEKDLFLEHACFVGEYYGTPKEFVYEQMGAGKNVILEIEQQGAFQVKAKEPSAVMIFMMPPCEEELVRRLRERGSETEEQIRRRLERGKVERENIGLYDHVIVNEDVEKSAQMLHNIMRS